jgi:hypothetical protein
MKKNSLKTVLVIGSIGIGLLCPSLAFAEAPQKWGWRPVGGINIATLSVKDPYVSSEAGIGANFGGQYSVPLTEDMEFTASVLFSMKNSSLSEWGAPRLFLQNHYIEVPFKYNFKMGSGLSFVAGGYASYLVNARAEIYGQSLDVKSSYNPLDYGALIGIGYKKGAWNFELGYQLGLSNPLKNASVQNNYSTLCLTASFSN